MERNVLRQKHFYDAKATLHIYNVGDVVWYLAEVRKEGLNPKLASPYIGPCVILKKYNLVEYHIQLDKKGTKRTEHYVIDIGRGPVQYG